MFWVVAVAVMLIALLWYAGVRDAYDQWRWESEPYYPRYGATHLEVMHWYLVIRRRECDKRTAKRRPRRAF